MKSMKCTFVLILISLFAEAQWNMQWRKHYDDSGHSNDISSLLVPDPAGGVFTIGYTFNPSFQRSDMLILKYDDAGQLMWSELFARSGDRTEKPHGAVLDHAGNLIVTGEGFNTNNVADILILKYSSSGSLLWEDSIDGTSNMYDRGISVCVDDSDNIYMTGYIYNGAFKGFLTKYTPSGNQVFHQIITGLQQGQVVHYENGTLLLHGITGASGFPAHTAIYRYDLNGNSMGSYVINDANDNRIVKAVSSGNRIYLLDARGGGTSGVSSYGVHCIDSSFNQLWFVYQTIANDLYPVSMSVHDTSIIVSANEWSGGMNGQYSGELRRFRTVDGSLSAQAAVNASPVMFGNISSQVMDSSGMVSLGYVTNGNASGNYVKHLLRFNSQLQQTALLALPDSMTFDDIDLVQKDNHTIYYASAAYDTIGLNRDFLLYKLSDITVGVDEQAAPALVSVYPNPVKDLVTITAYTSSEMLWSLFDLQGREIYKGSFSYRHEFAVSRLSAGMYVLQVTDGKQTTTMKIQKPE